MTLTHLDVVSTTCRTAPNLFGDEIIPLLGRTLKQLRIQWCNNIDTINTIAQVSVHCSNLEVLDVSGGRGRYYATCWDKKASTALCRAIAEGCPKLRAVTCIQVGEILFMQNLLELLPLQTFNCLGSWSVDSNPITPFNGGYALKSLSIGMPSDIFWIDLDIVNERVEAVVKGLSGFPNLEELCINGFVGENTLDAFADGSPGLKRLSIRSVLFDDIGIQILPRFKSVTHLSIITYDPCSMMNTIYETVIHMPHLQSFTCNSSLVLAIVQETLPNMVTILAEED
jgi:hypothetical protein